MTKYTPHTMGIVARGIASVTLLLGLFACAKDTPIPPRDMYPEAYSPIYGQVRFEEETKLPVLELSIDNIHMLIYNQQMLPFGVKYDSAYLHLPMSNAFEQILTNETTNSTTVVDPSSPKKVDLTGGRLTLRVAPKGEDQSRALTYRIRLQAYGYDPTKYTWRKNEKTLPQASDDAAVVEHAGSLYWLARVGQDLKLYRVDDLPSVRFSNVPEADVPRSLQPKSLYTDHTRTIWAIDDAGTLYSTTDLRTWIPRTSPTEVRLSFIVSDAEQSKESKSPRMILIGTPGGAPTSTGYALYTYTDGVVARLESLPKTFPVRNGYVYDYVRGGTLNANIVGGEQADGQPVQEHFFTSDWTNWGRIPYSTGKQLLPRSGALYLQSEGQLFAIGGVYEGNTPTNRIRVSNDRGVTWEDIAKEQAASDELKPRTGLSGTVHVTDSVPTFYLLGGAVGGRPSAEMWMGFQDKTGGIINDVTSLKRK